MRLLYISNGFPYPLTSGFLRHYFLLRELSRSYAITLLSLVGPGFREDHVEAVRPFTEEVHTFRSTSRRRSRADKALRRLSSWLVVEPAVRRMGRTVERLSRERTYDAIFCGKRSAPSVRPLRHVPLVADMCDAASMRIQLSMRYAGPARRLFLWLVYQQTRRIERHLLRTARHSVFVSARDREALLGESPRNSTIVPNGVDIEYWQRTSASLGDETIVFTGAMDYRPNADAALYLVHEILPRVRRAVPAAQAWIVGRDPGRELRQAASKPGVEVTGYVQDLRPYLEKASVFAAPLRFGAGVQNKILEAMAMEVPVVTTSLAATGLAAEDGSSPPVVVADSAQAFADALVARLRSGAKSPDAAARSYVASQFDWCRSAALLDRVIREATRAAEPDRSGS